MAVHLTRIYTRTGDDGTTGLSDFSRVPKNDARLDTLEGIVTAHLASCPPAPVVSAVATATT